MTNRILLHAHADENTVQFRTVGARVKSPRRFYVTYGELDLLRRDGHIISNDIHCFLQARLDERRDQATFEFTWLAGRSFDRVEGFEQTVRIRWSRFQAFLEECRQPDGPRDFKALSLDVSKHRPRLVSAPPSAIRWSAVSWGRRSWPTSTGPAPTRSTSPTTSSPTRSSSGNSGEAAPVCAAG